MADNEEDLVDYDEEEEEQNVAAEEAADAEGKEVKKWVIWQSSPKLYGGISKLANDVGGWTSWGSSSALSMGGSVHPWKPTVIYIGQVMMPKARVVCCGAPLRYPLREAPLA